MCYRRMKRTLEKLFSGYLDITIVNAKFSSDVILVFDDSYKDLDKLLKLFKYLVRCGFHANLTCFTLETGSGFKILLQHTVSQHRKMFNYVFRSSYEPTNDIRFKFTYEKVKMCLIRFLIQEACKR